MHTQRNNIGLLMTNKNENNSLIINNNTQMPFIFHHSKVGYLAGTWLTRQNSVAAVALQMRKTKVHSRTVGLSFVNAVTTTNMAVVKTFLDPNNSRPYNQMMSNKYTFFLDCGPRPGVGNRQHTIHNPATVHYYYKGLVCWVWNKGYICL